MISVNELKDILKPYFKIDKRRLDCMVQVLFALVTVRTVNLVEIAQAMVQGATFEARYKRLRRFFKEFNGFGSEVLARFIAMLTLPAKAKWQLSLDRTNWKWGRTDINLLVLSATCGAVGVPLIWKSLPKQGNSSPEERIEVIERFIDIFGHSQIDELLADREFVGKAWFSWLENKRIPFTIRLKKNILVKSVQQKDVPRLFFNLKHGEKRYIKQKKDVLGVPLWLASTRNEKGQLIIVATTHEPERALARYKKRWNIEILFGFLKSKAFNFEDTRIIHPERLHNLFSILAIAFCLAYKVGKFGARQSPIKLKSHGRPGISILRLGLDALREVFLSMRRSVDNFIKKATKNRPGKRLAYLIFTES